jgi:NAD(P)-dependent dehydrogenase (short-subunit alcohol dehydrogenase family)
MEASVINSTESLPMRDRTVLITGGTGGIGLHTAVGLAAQGARVVITGRDERRGGEAVASIRARAGNDRVEFVATDHLTVGANQDLALRLRGSLERLDVLVNNVGRVFPTREETADGYEATLALCFAGPAALTEGLLRLLQASASARVVNLSSSAYKMWRPDPLEDVQSRERYIGIQAHAHAKLLGLIWTAALAQRLEGAGVTVNATNPGAAWTPGTAQLTPEAVPAWKYVWPLVRFFQKRGSAEKAASAAVWLASAPDAGEISGMYVEKSKSERPGVAADPQNQGRVMQLAERLVSSAPTARSSHSDPQGARSDADQR